ncbi:hypothetical protein HMSSN036_50320 [Paenibacillus macerans]|nr:hypothetical protein HMSSN036_50320 [Paenibacillus macerans]
MVMVAVAVVVIVLMFMFAVFVIVNVFITHFKTSCPGLAWLKTGTIFGSYGETRSSYVSLIYEHMLIYRL